jgi:hypothetical protein
MMLIEGGFKGSKSREGVAVDDEAVSTSWSGKQRHYIFDACRPEMLTFVRPRPAVGTRCDVSAGGPCAGALEG